MANPTLNSYFQTFQTNAQGQIALTGILNVEAYNTINLEIIQWPHAAVSMTVQCVIGQISGDTVAQSLAQFPLGTASQIYTFNVIGPEFAVTLIGGPANTAVPIQGWVFLH